MSDISDFFESIKNHVQDRLTSPLAGAFGVSWVLWNYKALFVLFSDMKPEEKFGLLSGQVWVGWPQIGYMCFLYPALSALAYILVYPWFSRQAYKYSAWQDNLTKKARIKASRERAVTEAELKQTEEKYEARISNLQARLDKSESLVTRYETAESRSEEAEVKLRLAMEDAQANEREAQVQLKEARVQLLSEQAKVSEIENRRAQSDKSLSEILFVYKQLKDYTQSMMSLVLSIDDKYIETSNSKNPADTKKFFATLPLDLNKARSISVDIKNVLDKQQMPIAYIEAEEFRKIS